MQIIESYKNISEAHRGAVVVIGNFDGVHRGHQQLLSQARTLADEKGAPLAVLTFEPHPHRLFRPDEPPSRITPTTLKAERLESAEINIMFSVPFDWDFASQSAEDFIQNVLKDGVGAAHVVVGYDFCFGQLRKGTPAMIEESGLPTTIVEQISDDTQEKLSSSRIRQSLRHGRIDDANRVLGWDWEIRGEIVKGDQRGRELGYPTANVPLKDTIHPAYGIYATWVRIEGEEEWRAAATNIGIRPMFEIPTAQVEAHILDFDRDIYGKILHIRPVKRLRGEAKFNSLEDLIAQMERDCLQVREILRK